MHTATVDSIWIRLPAGVDGDMCYTTRWGRHAVRWAPYGICDNTATWLRVIVGVPMIVRGLWEYRDVVDDVCETCAIWNRVPLAWDPRPVEEVDVPDDNCDRCDCLLVYAVPRADGGHAVLCERCAKGDAHNCNDWYAQPAKCDECNIDFTWIPDHPDDSMPYPVFCPRCDNIEARRVVAVTS